MKKTFRNISLVAVMLVGSALVNNLHADPPPPPSGGHGQAGNQGGGAAPPAGGAALLIGLAAGYGARKVWANYQKNDKE